MRLGAPERDFLPASRREWAFVSKITPPTAGSLREDGGQRSSPLRGAPRVPRSASLTAILAPAVVLLWGARLPRFI
jgi:hypothetical protein